ncbi:signal peptidase I [Haloarchaeobius sp. HME9146]|uniref:signal peptidase I n=1 Tax=Haloarchaeobius sp. HME9146 TaxID=2978732 RepID=UPI0021BE8E96|nr:signal peptidase I [Haloarchaeobius sp. HME9146]MCT9096542.1 signal peptidase I [Haloarchaeobius sp. HME9146]
MTRKDSNDRRWLIGGSLRTAINVVALLLLLVVVIPFIIYAVPQVAGGDQSYVVLTGSMEPAISPGDVVIVTHVDPTTIEVGDVIIYERANMNVPTTHRVVERTTTETGDIAFVTKGDANEDTDSGLVTTGAVIGEISLTLPKVGYVIQFVNSETGFLALVLVPFGLLILTEIWSLIGTGLLGRKEQDGDAEANEPVVTAAEENTSGGGSAGDVATATAGGATAAAAIEDEEEALTFTRDELRIGLGVTGLLVLYSGVMLWLVYSRMLGFQQFLTVSMMGFVASIGLLVLLGSFWRQWPEATEEARSVTDGGVTMADEDERRAVMTAPVKSPEDSSSVGGDSDD